MSSALGSILKVKEGPLPFDRSSSSVANLDDLSRGTVLGKNWPVVLEEPGRVVVNVLDDHGEGGRGRLGRVPVVDGQDLDLVRGRDFAVEGPLDGHGAVGRDGTADGGPSSGRSSI